MFSNFIKNLKFSTIINFIIFIWKVMYNVVYLLFFIFIINTALTLLFPIEKQNLNFGSWGVGVDYKDGKDCQLARLPNLWKPNDHHLKLSAGYPDPFNLNFNREEVANKFTEYAALAANTYKSKDDLYFDISKLPVKWKLLTRHQTNSGLVVDFYSSDHPERPMIVIAFRGTDGLFAFLDILSNASWLFGKLNPYDQYSEARIITKEVLEELGKKGKLGKTAVGVNIVAVGHSLGGGLARHVSQAFPCISAISINGSPVRNSHQLQYKYNPQFVEIFEDLDWLNKLYHSFFPPRTINISSRWQYYRMNNIEGVDSSNHSSFKTVAAMARMVHVCHQRAGCSISWQDDLVSQLWCEGINKKYLTVKSKTCSLKQWIKKVDQ